MVLRQLKNFLCRDWLTYTKLGETVTPATELSTHPAYFGIVPRPNQSRYLDPFPDGIGMPDCLGFVLKTICLNRWWHAGLCPSHSLRHSLIEVNDDHSSVCVLLDLIVSILSILCVDVGKKTESLVKSGKDTDGSKCISVIEMFEKNKSNNCETNWKLELGLHLDRDVVYTTTLPLLAWQ